MRPTNKSMKRLSLYLFLILFTLPTPSQANDIRDFQIEGLSIGDSLLNYYSIDSLFGFKHGKKRAFGRYIMRRGRAAIDVFKKQYERLI